MSVTASKTVREVALKLPGAAWVFEKLGIDRCCRGGEVHRATSRSANLAEEQPVPEEVSQEPDWNTAPLSTLTNYIVTKHHKFTREELPRLSQLHVKVCSVHGRNHPELVRIHSILQDLQEGLMNHMLKEEETFFPCIEQLQEAADRGEVAPVPFPCGTLRNPLEALMQEHDDAQQALRRLRECSSNYAVPADACNNFRALYQALEAFEKDFQQHIHLENNILFPRAAKLETPA
jgi:regulator of cell morphogenesis and NO signaling